MGHQGGWIQRLLRSGSNHAGALLGFAVAVGLFSLPALVFGADVAPAAPTEYRDVPYVGSRNVIWVVAQLHLLLAGFVLGVPMSSSSRRSISSRSCAVSPLLAGRSSSSLISWTR